MKPLRLYHKLRKHLQGVTEFEKLVWVVTLASALFAPLVGTAVAVACLVTGLPLWGLMAMAVPFVAAALLGTVYLCGRYNKFALAMDGLLIAGLGMAGEDLFMFLAIWNHDGPPLWFAVLWGVLAVYVLALYGTWKVSWGRYGFFAYLRSLRLG